MRIGTDVTSGTTIFRAETLGSHDQPVRTYCARWILPIADPPIHGGWIRISGDTVVDLGSGSPPGSPAPGKTARAESGWADSGWAESGQVIDLGDVAILPGLVNAHTHLEFSDLDQPVGFPGIEFGDWIQRVIATRGQVSQEMRDAAIQRGLTESSRGGVRLIGDITTPLSTYPRDDSPVEVVQLSEVIGLTPDRGQQRYAAAMRQHALLEPTLGHLAGVSPHAPYSTRPELVDQCIRWSAQRGGLLAMHLAESPAERELLCGGSGPLADALGKLGVLDRSLFPSAFCKTGDPLSHLIRRLSACHRGLLVHCNDFRDAEIAELAKHRNLSVVFCPRTHAYFQFRNHPVATMLAAGITVALGTDSRASNPDLNLWRDVQFLLNHRPDIDPHVVLELATRGGADAMGRPDLGRLRATCRPGLNCFPTAARNADQLFRDLADPDRGLRVGL